MISRPDLCTSCNSFIRVEWKTHCGTCGQQFFDPEAASIAAAEAKKAEAPRFANGNGDGATGSGNANRGGVIAAAIIGGIFITFLFTVILCIAAVTFIGSASKSKFSSVGSGQDGVPAQVSR